MSAGKPCRVFDGKEYEGSESRWLFPLPQKNKMAVSIFSCLLHTCCEWRLESGCVELGGIFREDLTPVSFHPHPHPLPSPHPTPPPTPGSAYGRNSPRSERTHPVSVCGVRSTFSTLFLAYVALTSRPGSTTSAYGRPTTIAIASFVSRIVMVALLMQLLGLRAVSITAGTDHRSPCFAGLDYRYQCSYGYDCPR